MAKLTRKQKIELYNKRKQGQTVASLSKEYKINQNNIQYLIRLLDMHGFSILKFGKNKYYSSHLKLEIINRVLIDHQSVSSTAIEYGLPSIGMLTNWIRSYKENGCVIVEKTKGRVSTMKQKNNLNKKYEEMKLEEKIKYLEEKNHYFEAKNQYLEAENAYLKKLRAVVQSKKNQHR